MISMTQRFQRSRWSKTRRMMDAMKPGESITRPNTEWNNAVTSAQRLAYAYDDDRKWSVSRKRTHLEITRTA
jgi:hypothetical protein